MKTMRNQAKHILRAGLAVILVLSMLVSASVMCFAEETDTSTETVVKVGIKDMDVSLGEDIMVRFYTDSTTDDDSKLVVAFDGKEYEITQSQYVENKGNAFMFIGVTPQKLGDEMTATLYGADGVQIGETKTVSVKSYLEGLLALSYEDSGLSQLKYQAMRELCVNMLNYGAAAQTYVDYKKDNLVNKDLSDELKALATEKITVTDTDKAVNGDAWVGAGVRFDYKLGLYFVFRAASAYEYTATINGTEVTPEAYTALGEGYYVIRYNSFNATNMNDVVTAKLTKDGADDQTFSYSIKSYVASKGGDESAIANLVNATYVYGFAAVAYSAEYVTVDPTFEEAGSISMDGKGYDFTQSKYGTVTLPKLDFENYTVETVNSGTATAPVVTTSFKWNDTRVDYTCDLKSNDYINIDNAIYSQYDFTQQTNEGLTIEYNAQSGYTVTGNNASVSNLTTGGADLTIKGTVNTTGALTSTSPSLIIDGALTVAGKVVANTYYFEENSNYEYGFKPQIYVREGTLNCSQVNTFLLQVGSEREGCKGTLILSDDTQLVHNLDGGKKTGYAKRYVFAKGTLNATCSGSTATVIDCRTGNENGGHVYFGDGMNIVISKANDTAAILRLVGAMQNATCYYSIYMDKNVNFTYTNGELSNEFANLSYAVGRVNRYGTTTVNAVIDGENKNVRLVNAALNLESGIFNFDDLKASCPDENTVKGKVLTLGTETITYGIMGEFTQITHIDGVALDTPIYCQILDWEVSQ